MGSPVKTLSLSSHVELFSKEDQERLNTYVEEIRGFQ